MSSLKKIFALLIVAGLMLGSFGGVGRALAALPGDITFTTPAATETGTSITVAGHAFGIPPAGNALSITVKNLGNSMTVNPTVSPLLIPVADTAFTSTPVTAASLGIADGTSATVEVKAELIGAIPTTIKTMTFTWNRTTPVATLVSIAVTPATITLPVGGTQQFTATGTYSDATTANLTSTVTWSANAPAGLFTATAAGTYLVTATSGTVSGTATVNVTSGTVTGGTITGLKTASAETLLPTYTFIDDAVVTGYYYSPLATTHPISISVTNGPTVNVFQVGQNQYMFTFALKSPIMAEGVKTITVVDGAYGATQNIYVAYKVAVTANPTPAYNTASFLYGTVSNAEGAAPVSQIALINGLAGSSTTVLPVAVTAGVFNFSYNFPSRGDWRLVLSNTANVPTYKLWQLGGSITATTVLDPNPIYASGAAQQSYLYLSYEDGSAVTGASISLASGVNSSFLATEIGNGFYLLSGPTTTTVGNNYYTIAKGGLSIGYTLYFKAVDSVWNPVVTITPADLLNYGPSGVLHFAISYGVNTTNYQLNDYATSVTGPGKWYSTTKSFYVQYGGQVKITMDANLWYNATATDLTAKPVDVEQVFTVNPAIAGDQVTISTVKVNKGDTKDITVTVKKANGIERNNAKVELISTVAGMFTAPVGSIYTVSYDGKVATLDASGLVNYNIVGGNYVFAGLTFNHKGYIEVKVTGTDYTIPWVTADFQGVNSSVYGIRVYPTAVTLTADITKFTAGVSYPVVNVTGAVAGLTGWTVSDLYGAGDNPTFSFVDKGSGAYVFNFNTMTFAFGSLTLSTYDSTGDIQYKITFPVSMPTLTFTSAHSDGKLTDSFAETVTFQVTDPVTGAAIVPSFAGFFPQHLASCDACDNGDPYLNEIWDPGISTAELLKSGVYGYDISTNTVKIAGLQATTGNPYVDYTKNNATLWLQYTVNGIDLYFMDALVVTAPSITINKPVDTLVALKKNTINVTALDAHGAPMVKAAVALAGQSEAAFTGDYIATLMGFGGITNNDGVVEFYATPSYMGTYRLVLGAPIYGPDLVTITGYSIVYRKDILSVAPAADTTAPVIAVADGIDGTTVTSGTLMVKGTVTDDTDTITYIYINGNQVNVVGGAFTYTVKLVAGANSITLQAADSSNNLATKTITVTLAAPKAGTVIVLTIGTDVVTVDGKATSIDAAPEIINSRTFVPIRFISETFGADVEWLAETQGITITLGDSTIGLQIGNATAVIDGNIVSLPAAPYIKNGRTMVPLRVISDAFGGDVVWDAALRTITITYVQP